MFRLSGPAKTFGKYRKLVTYTGQVKEDYMKSKLWHFVAASMVTLALGAGPVAAKDPNASAADSAKGEAKIQSSIPKYVVDPYWPKPLPNRWVTGEVGGICVDSNDHIFGINR